MGTQERNNASEVERRAEIEDLLVRVEDAWDRGDVHAYTSLYAEDAGYVSRAGAVWEGRGEIERQHVVLFAGILRNTRIKLHTRAIRFVTPQVAIVHAGIDLTREKDASRAFATFVVSSAGGSWRIAAAHASEVSG